MVRQSVTSSSRRFVRFEVKGEHQRESGENGLSANKLTACCRATPTIAAPTASRFSRCQELARPVRRL
jgi:hypothetical protein